jgi:toxin YoeB
MIQAIGPGGVELHGVGGVVGGQLAGVAAGVGEHRDGLRRDQLTADGIQPLAHQPRSNRSAIRGLAPSMESGATNCPRPMPSRRGRPSSLRLGTEPGRDTRAARHSTRPDCTRSARPGSYRPQLGGGDAWAAAAWDDYLHWQSQDRRQLRRINQLIQACLRDPFDGIGKPEPLRENLAGCWSRRIDEEHRLVYRLEGELLVILACRYHYR